MCTIYKKINCQTIQLYDPVHNLINVIGNLGTKINLKGHN